MSQQAKNSSFSPLLKTLMYSSIFQFPLTLDEVWRYLLSDKPLSKETVLRMLNMISPTIIKKKSYYVLQGDEKFVDKRLREKSDYRQKLLIAKRAVALLSMIPSIQFVGISGSLAAGSASKESDIDFFIITAPKTLWTTRLLTILLLSLKGVRRKRGVKNASNKICLNIFLERTHLSYFALSKDLYTAHELAQLYPLLNRKKVYEELLSQNGWYLDFLPNAHPRKNGVSISTRFSPYEWIIRLLNPFCAFFQMLYMKNHQTKEVVTKELLFLHPHDYKNEIMTKYKQKLMEYDSLTKI